MSKRYDAEFDFKPFGATLKAARMARKESRKQASDALNISPRYMSTIVKAVSGKAAKQWIDDAITTRIKVELRHSDYTIAQIADKMNFANPSFFCKFFKRTTGMTTQAYRDMIAGKAGQGVGKTV